jgi:hypothetical protein
LLFMFLFVPIPCWLLWLCSTVWSQVLWYLQHCSFSSRLLWLFKVFCVFIWTLGLTFLSQWRM